MEKNTKVIKVFKKIFETQTQTEIAAKLSKLARHEVRRQQVWQWSRTGVVPYKYLFLLEKITGIDKSEFKPGWLSGL